MNIFWLCLLFLETVLSQSSPELIESSSSTEASRCKKWICLNEEFGDKFQTRNKAIKELKSTISSHLWKALVKDVVDMCFDNYTAPASYENSCDHDIYYCIIEKFTENCPERYIRDGTICSTIDCEDDIKTSMCQQRRIRLNPNLTADIMEEYNRKCCFLGVIFNPDVMTRCGLLSELYQKHVRIHSPTHHPNVSTVPSETDYIRTIASARDYGVTSTFSSDSNSSAHRYGVAMKVPSDTDEPIYINSSVYNLHSKVASESDGYPVNWNANETNFYEDNHTILKAAKNGSLKRLTAEMPFIVMTIRSLMLVYVMK